MDFGRVAIVGVGLIGGSLGLVLREKGAAGSVVGIDIDEGNLRAAKELGIVDECTTSLEGVKGADLVVLATPVCTIIEVAERIRGLLKEGTIVTDVGSVKGEVVARVEPLMPEGVHFVGGHPIAGTENSGPKAAFSSLFKGKRCILTPTERTDGMALRRVKELWELAGAEVVMMDPRRHDRICAAISHLPHIVAYSLVNTIGDVEDEDLLHYSAGGFRDFTRIAMSPARMWRDICLLNRDEILAVLDLYQDKLRSIRTMIENGDGEGLEKEFERSREVKERIDGRGKG